MDAKEEGRILGKLEAGFNSIDYRLKILEAKVDSINNFKWKATGIMIGVLGFIELIFRAIQTMAK